jgi:predicted nucleic acid-binding protein
MSADRTAVDANVLVYAFYRDTPQHAASRAWLDRRAVRGEVEPCLTSQVLAEFFAIVSNPKRVSDPRTPDDAVAARDSALLAGFGYQAEPGVLATRGYLQIKRTQSLNGTNSAPPA